MGWATALSVLVFGSSGQVGRSLLDVQENRKAFFVSRKDCELTDIDQIKAVLEQKRPSIIINAAAYTSVDSAEQESNRAHLVNEVSVRCMASYAQANNAKLIHFSTDFVFDGKHDSPYQPEEYTNPLGAYGKSKLAGERAVLEEAPESAMIIRTSWVFSEHRLNFVKSMLRLMREKQEISVVNDQRGSPTYAGSLADIVWQISDRGLFTPGIFHWTDEGDVTWFEFAQAIQEEALNAGRLQKSITINEIATSEYPTLAPRPAFSVLDNSKLVKLVGVKPIPWRQNLRKMLSRL